MLKNKKDELSFNCKHCENKNIGLLKSDVKKEEVIFPNNVKKTIIYFDCPICKTRYYAQIDDDRTSRKLQELRSELFKFSFKKEKMTPKEIKRAKAKCERFTKELRELREELAKGYDNKFFVVENNLLESGTFSNDMGYVDLNLKIIY